MYNTIILEHMFLVNTRLGDQGMCSVIVYYVIFSISGTNL